MEAFRALPVFVAVTLAMPLLVSAAERDQDSETATRPEYGLKLNAARRLDENAPSEEGDAPTYLTAFKMIGTPNEKIELIDSAEVRRGGSVLRGDTITYTFANDEVYSNGNALVARNGTIFKGPELTYHLDAETGEMPNATFRYLPTQMRGTSDKIELLGEGKAKMCHAAKVRKPGGLKPLTLTMTSSTVLLSAKTHAYMSAVFRFLPRLISVSR